MIKFHISAVFLSREPRVVGPSVTVSLGGKILDGERHDYEIC